MQGMYKYIDYLVGLAQQRVANGVVWGDNSRFSREKWNGNLSNMPLKLFTLELSIKRIYCARAFDVRTSILRGRQNQAQIS